MGIEAIGEAVDLIKAGNPPRIVQDESKATYDPPCGDEHAKIDWSKPAQEVYDLIRGCDPQPGAHTTWQGKMVRIFDALFSRGNNAASQAKLPAIGEEEITIALNGGILTVRKCAAKSAKLTLRNSPNKSI